MKILIVDDDILICNWLTMLLGQIPGYSLTVCHASDVSSAMEYCRSNAIDLVITDITMPQISGLQLLEMLRLEYPNIQTAVLSAYDDYEYIRYALRQGSLDYILKSEMKLEDVVSLLDKATMALELSHADRRIPRESYQHFRKRNNALQAFLSQTEGSDFPGAELYPFIHGDTGIYVFRIVQMPEMEAERYQLQSVAQRTLANEKIDGAVFSHAKDMFLILYQARSRIAEEQQDAQMKLSLLLQRNLNSYCECHIDYSVFRMSRRPGNLQTDLLECLLLMDMHSYYPSAKISPPIFRLESDVVQRFIKTIKNSASPDNGGNLSVRALLAEALTDWHSRMTAPEDIKTALRHAVMQIANSLNSQAFDFFHADEFQNAIAEVNAAVTKDQVAQAVERFSVYFENNFQKGGKILSPAIRAAMAYIEQNYAKKLTLDEVAAQIYLNKSYVSQLFKKSLNIGFGEYLENVRINKAKELIQATAKSMSQIAEEVGYANQSYFTAVFKKLTGMGPLSYRDTVNKKNHM